MANGDGMAAIMVGRLRCRFAGSGSPDDSTESTESTESIE